MLLAEQHWDSIVEQIFRSAPVYIKFTVIPQCYIAIIYTPLSALMVHNNKLELIEHIPRVEVSNKRHGHRWYHAMADLFFEV